MSKPLLGDLTCDNAVDKLDALFTAIMTSSYLGETVTVGDHMLQCAARAQAEGADDALVAAALLHDVGYYVDAAPDNDNETRPDKRHDVAAGRVLSPLLPAAVVEPLRLHVEAKRYLCAVEPDYHGKLSAASVHTLRLQGGPLDADQAAAFRAGPHAAAAVRVRRWDEAAKEKDARVPGFAHYRPLLARLVAAHKAAG